MLNISHEVKLGNNPLFISIPNRKTYNYIKTVEFEPPWNPKNICLNLVPLS